MKYPIIKYKAAIPFAVDMKMLVAIALGASLLTLIPAMADNDNGHANNHGNQGYQGQHWQNNGNHYQQGYRNNRPYYYGYAQPLYAPPPMYYGPQPSPGVSIFLPLDLRIY